MTGYLSKIRGHKKEKAMKTLMIHAMIQQLRILT
jgi:hypothetical protein